MTASSPTRSLTLPPTVDSVDKGLALRCSCLTSWPSFVTLRALETHAFGFRLWANARRAKSDFLSVSLRVVLKMHNTQRKPDVSMMNRRDLAYSASAHDEGHGGVKGKRTFVLIHGAWTAAAWHGGFAWDGVAERLRHAGHDVEARTLPGMNPGENRLGIEFGDYVDAVVDTIRQQGKSVTLVGHSSAGMLMQAAVHAWQMQSTWWYSATPSS
jgi:Alpha/beta hydrolase family